MLVGEDEMVQERDAEQLRSLPEPAGEHAIFLAWCGIAGRVIVCTNPSTGVHQDQRLKHLSRMHDGQGQRADRDDIDPDDAVLGIEPADQELFAVQPIKERSQNCRSSDRSPASISTPAQPDSTARRAAEAKPSTSKAISGASITCGCSRDTASATGEGAHRGCGE